jgi:hypothetical protein
MKPCYDLAVILALFLGATPAVSKTVEGGMAPASKIETSSSRLPGAAVIFPINPYISDPVVRKPAQRLSFADAP